MKKIWKKTIYLAFCLATAQTAFAANCTTTISNNAIDKITVPAGGTCTLNSTAVSGNVSVQKGASLILNSSSVDGSVNASGAKSVKLINSSVEGNLKADQISNGVSLTNSAISGDFYCSTLTRLQSVNSVIDGKTVGKCK